MSQLYVPVILRNTREYVLARHGHLAGDQVHTYETSKALIDTGALHTILPRYVATQLGLLLMGYTDTTMADGRLVEGEMTEPVTIEILRRQISIHALIMGDTVLIGALALEGLDLAVMAESYKTVADTQQILAQTQLRMEETARDIAQTQRLGFRLQGFALVLLGLSLRFTVVVVWQHLAMRHENAALNQAVLTNTQTIAAQTQALLERLGQR